MIGHLNMLNLSAVPGVDGVDLSIGGMDDAWVRKFSFVFLENEILSPRVSSI